MKSENSSTKDNRDYKNNSNNGQYYFHKLFWQVDNNRKQLVPKLSHSKTTLLTKFHKRGKIKALNFKLRIFYTNNYHLRKGFPKWKLSPESNDCTTCSASIPLGRNCLRRFLSFSDKRDCKTYKQFAQALTVNKKVCKKWTAYNLNKEIHKLSVTLPHMKAPLLNCPTQKFR